MKRKRTIILIVILILGIVGIMKLNTQLKYNLNLRDYYHYNSEINLSLEEVVGERSLLVGVYDEPPITFLNKFNNYNAGIVVDYISQIAIEIRKDILLKVLPQRELLKTLAKGEADIVIVKRSREVEEKFDLTQTICVMKGRVLVRASDAISGIDDLHGRTLVTLTSDNSDDRIITFFKPYGDIKIVEVDNMYQCFALINSNLAVGFVGDDMEAAHFLNVTNRETNFKFLKPVLYEEEFCMAVQKGNERLLSVLNKGILELKKKNLIAQTQDKWLGDFESASMDIRKIELAYKVFLAVLSIIIFFSVWNYVITQKVNTKTRELSESKEKLRLIIDTMQSGIMVIENHSTIVECNDTIIRLLGVEKAELIGMNYNTIDALKPFMDEENMNRVFNVDNAYYYVTKQPFSGSKILIVIEDYTDKYFHEMRLRQESKMIAVGQLSAGLAHEIRNPLGLIKSYSYVIDKYCKDGIGQHALSVINDSVGRINKLIENLLRFSKLSSDESKQIDVEILLQDILALEGKNFELNGIRVICKVGGGPQKTVIINEDILKMILLNLINNSIDSFKEIQREDKVIEIAVEVSDTRLNIQIKDNGCGIEKEIQENIFNPFYSTKETGTGLGLYLIGTEIANHKGTITVESDVGEGTVFNILLPIKENANGL